MTIPRRTEERARAAMRIMTGLLFVEYGTVQLFGFPVRPTTTPGLLPIIAGVIDTVGGTLIAIGLFTRSAALISSGTMAVGYLLVHVRHGFFPSVNHGQMAITFCFVFFYLAVAGPGAWSVDDWRSRRHHRG